MVEELLQSEIEEFYKKATIPVRVKLKVYLIGGQGEKKWQGTEIAARFGFPSNRQSEIKDPVKYPDAVISQPILRKLIAGGFITVKEIESTVNLTSRERIYLSELAIHENKSVHDSLIAATRAGCSEEEIAKTLHALAATKK
jgi:hypothetical protein